MNYSSLHWWLKKILRVQTTHDWWEKSKKPNITKCALPCFNCKENKRRQTFKVCVLYTKLEQKRIDKRTKEYYVNQCELYHISNSYECQVPSAITKSIMIMKCSCEPNTLPLVLLAIMGYSSSTENFFVLFIWKEPSDFTNSIFFHCCRIIEFLFRKKNTPHYFLMKWFVLSVYLFTVQLLFIA